MPMRAAIVVLCLLAGSVLAEATLVRNIAPEPNNTAGSFLDYYATLNGTVYFSVRPSFVTSAIPPALWKTDGTAAGTERVKDFSVLPKHTLAWNGSLYFSAGDPSAGEELFKSDGTTAGTVLLKDIGPGVPSSSPADLVVFQNQLFFTADDGVNGRELWVSDGTEAGTQMLVDINPGAADAFGTPKVSFCVVGGQMFFVANDGTNGYELWVTDGTAGGTALVKDIRPGAASSLDYGTSKQWLTDFNGTLYFSADDGVVGRELWKSDGTAAGTQLVIDWIAGNADPVELTVVGANLFFSVEPSSRFLLVSDGTAAGTFKLLPGFSEQVRNVLSLRNMGGVLIFFGNRPSSPKKLWRSDGTDAGTVEVSNPVWSGFPPVTPYFLTVVDTRLFFVASISNGREPWISDGTIAGTTMIRDINPGTADGALDPTLLTIRDYYYPVNSYVLFTANEGVHGLELWRTDGTAAGTELVKNLSEGRSSSPRNLKDSNGVLYCHISEPGTNAEPWTSDGTSAGTNLLKDLSPGVPSSQPSEFASFNGATFFRAFNTGANLWKTDGTTAGTFQVTDATGTQPTSVGAITPFAGKLYFVGEGTQGGELWETDGTQAGTLQVKDINPSGHAHPSGFTVFGGKLLFTATTPSAGRELWSSDGTAAGTVQVKDIYPGTQSGPDAELVEAGGLLFFRALDGVNGYELWKSDGTESGTVLVADIFAGGGGSGNPENLTNVNGTLFFTARDAANGRELWKSDGTAAGTVLVKDITVGAGNTNFTSLVASGSLLFFSVQTDELWVSDGTEAGTVQLKNDGCSHIVPLPGGGVVFAGWDAFRGEEIWQSDGTIAGTSFVTEVNPGLGSSGPALFTVSGNRLFFAATDRDHGEELWSMPLSDFGVTLTSTTTTLTSNNPNPTFGNTVTLTATVTGTGSPEGSVVFRNGIAVLGTRMLSAGTCSLSIQFPAGALSLSASYTGSSTHADSVGTLPLTVNKCGTSMVLSSPGSNWSGTSVSMTATVTADDGAAGTPDGTVTFKKDGDVLGSAALSGGVATLSPVLTEGVYSLTAEYSGSSNFNTSTSAPVSKTVLKAATTTGLTLSSPTAAYGDAITFTAACASVPAGTPALTGTVEFRKDGAFLATATLISGSAAINPQLAVGSYSITAHYSGDGNFDPSAASGQTQTVNKAATTTTLNVVPASVFGQTVGLTASVTPPAGTPAATGSITFKGGATTLATVALVNGSASFSSTFAVDAHSFTAEYSGDANLSASASSGTAHTVGAAGTTATLTASSGAIFKSSPLTLRLDVAAVAPGAGVPAGTARFFDNGTAIGDVALSAGSATLALASASEGAHTYTARYLGSTQHSASDSASVGVTVSNRAPTLSSTASATPNPAGVGQAVRFTVAASDADNDALTFAWTFGDGSSGAGASVSHAFAAAGSYAAQVVVTDSSSASVSGRVAVLVRAPVAGTGQDSDGDGFSDTMETASGSSPLDAASTPFGALSASGAQPLSLEKFSIKLNFKKSGGDSIQFGGSVKTPAATGGTRVMVDIGGVLRTFTLDDKGKGGSGADKFTLSKPSGAQVKFTLKLARGSFAADLAAHGLERADKGKLSTSVTIPVTVIFNQDLYFVQQSASYSANATSGTAKN